MEWNGKNKSKKNMNKEIEQLKILSIFHYVVGGITGLLACLPIVHLLMGILFLVIGVHNAGNSQDIFVMKLFGIFFILVALAFIAGGWALAISILLSGRFLKRRKHYTFCLVVAGIECQDSSRTATWDPYFCKGMGSETYRVLSLQSCLPVLLYLVPMQKLWSFFVYPASVNAELWSAF